MTNKIDKICEWKSKDGMGGQKVSANFLDIFCYDMDRIYDNYV